MKQPLKQDSDNEYTLTEESVWITVGNISVHIKKGDEGASVTLYPVDGEDDDSIAETYAFYAEAKPNEDEESEEDGE